MNFPVYCLCYFLEIYLYNFWFSSYFKGIYRYSSNNDRTEKFLTSGERFTINYRSKQQCLVYLCLHFPFVCVINSQLLFSGFYSNKLYIKHLNEMLFIQITNLGWLCCNSVLYCCLCKLNKGNRNWSVVHKLQLSGVK